MATEPNQDYPKVTPLSQSRRRTNNYINTTEDRLRELLSDVIDQRLEEKFSRWEKTLNHVVGQFEEFVNGDSDKAALRVTTDLEKADITLAGIKLPKEQYYPYTCSQIAEKLNKRKWDITQAIEKLGLRDNTDYNLVISTGTGEKSKVHKWSESAFQKIKDYLQNGLS
jgi:hypothetical protein